MKRLITFLLLILLPSLAFCYELNGTLSSNNDGDGTYSVAVQNNDGHYYTGTAHMLSNGTLVVTVTDDKGDSFGGSATPNEEGDFDLDLHNKVSGVQATGELETS